jgi:pyrimidine operon attenuation protein/uracil phosphoribosyltransferase
MVIENDSSQRVVVCANVDWKRKKIEIAGYSNKVKDRERQMAERSTTSIPNNVDNTSVILLLLGQ